MLKRAEKARVLVNKIPGTCLLFNELQLILNIFIIDYCVFSVPQEW